MFSKILVANRGEIALRVIRAVNELGIKSVAVYSEADAGSRHLEIAGESVLIGEAISAKSYLNMDNIFAAVEKTGADAIHPGYGYLAENQEFADRCKEKGITFIGPTAQSMKLAGDKITAKNLMEKAGIPIIPSSPGGVDTTEEAKNFARDIGYPILIKASGGGGGKGIRICHDEEELEDEFSMAKMEGRAAFGNDEVYIEKFIVNPRHIEFQILADSRGKVIHLGERECSIQRRYQKLIEEAPSPRLTPALRETMGRAAIAAAKAVDYLNAGTVEFLVDEDDNFYFIEINARIQVEHPVTELVAGIDLVKEQVRLAAGGKIDYEYEDLNPRGWAIECRINCEDPDKYFMPSPGIIEEYHPPGGYGVRLDTHIYQGYEIPIYYDSLVAKLIAYAPTRKEAIEVMRRALEEFKIAPIKTTIPLHLKVMKDEDFQKGEFNTNFIKKYVVDEDDDDDDDDD